MPQSEIAQKLQRLRGSYRESLPQRLWEIRDCWEAFVLGHERSGVAEELYHHLHRLAGSAKTFGLPRVSAAARRCLEELRPVCNQSDASLSPQARQICEDSLDEIADCLWQTGPVEEFVVTESPHQPGSAAGISIFAMPGDAALSELAERLRQKDYGVTVHPHTADPVPDQESNAILIDLNLVAPGAEDALLSRYQGQAVGALAGINDFEARVRAVRMGAQALFTRPFDLAEITLWLDNYLGLREENAGRIIYVTGGRAKLAGIDAYLKRQGYRVESLTNLEALLKNLSGFDPELIVIDSPDGPFSAREIAAAVRVDLKALALPILVVGNPEIATGESTPRIASVQFTPDDPQLLLAAIRDLLCRGRLLRSMMIRDSLTLLPNHGECHNQLRLALLRAERQGQSLCVGMVDIDHFKAINDRLGHAHGDRVLRNTARFIARTLRRTDVVGRYGGEEFLIILPDTDLGNARQIADALRKGYAAFNQGQENDPLHATLSIGLAAYPSFHSPEGLLRAADESMYKAKQDGRNRTVAAIPNSTLSGS